MPVVSFIGTIATTTVLSVGGPHLRSTSETHGDYRPNPAKPRVRRIRVVALSVVRIRTVARRGFAGPRGNVPELWTRRQAGRGCAPKLTTAATANAAGSTDSLDRWLSGEAIPVKRRGGWQHLTCWTRRHPRASVLAILALIGIVVLPIGSLTAYLWTAEALRQASRERTAIEGERAELKNSVSRTVAELKMQEDRWKSQQHARSNWKINCSS